MLIQLLKYDFMYYVKKLLPTYIFILVLCPTLYHTRDLPSKIPDSNIEFAVKMTHGIFNATAIAILVLIVGYTIYVLWKHFSRIMNTTEGYLVHTLPISPHTILIIETLSIVIT